MRIGFMGFGEAARAFVESLAAADSALSFLAYDRKLTESQSRAEMLGAMRAQGVVVAEDPAGLAAADWIFSAVTADQSLLAVEPLAPHLRQGQVLVDINSVSPGRKRETAALVSRAGVAYADMAVMAPVHPKGHATPVLLAGTEIEAVAKEARRLGFDLRVVGDAPGAATAIKMVRSVFVKGLEAITVETLLAAEASGCFDEIYASLSSSFPGLGWPDIAAYNFERTLRHGHRRAAEMVESGATLDALGLEGALPRAIAAVQQKMGDAGLGDADEPDLRATVAAALRRREGENRATEPQETNWHEERRG